MLTRIQLVLNGSETRLSAEVQLLPRQVTGLLKTCGVRRAAWWLHAEPAQDIIGIDTIIDLCPSELHIEIVTTDPVDDTALRSAARRYGFVTPVRRSEVFRDRWQERLGDLLLRSSRPLVEVGARTKAGHVVHRVGTRRSHGATRPGGRVDALTSKAKQPRSCSRCGEAVPAAEWAYFRPVDGSGRPAEVPWEDEEIHEVHDEPHGVRWERVDAWTVRLDE